MIKTTMNIRTCLALSLSCLLFTTVSALAQTKQEIVAAWQQQVNSFQTLQFDCELSLSDFTEPRDTDTHLTMKNKFAISGDKYYSYIQFTGDKGDFSALAAAYNGEYYQKLTDEKIGVTVYRTKEEDTFEQPYLGPDPVTTQYRFAFMPDQPRTIKNLKKPETWERLTQRITEIRPSIREGQEGFAIDIESPQEEKIYKVFVDKETLWPRHLSFVDHWIQDGTEEDEEAEDVDVKIDINTITSINTKEAVLKFPGQITLRGMMNGELVMQGFINTVPESLKINKPVPEDVFTLAPKDATFIDADEWRRIYEERRKQ